VNKALRISHVGLRGIVGQGLTATHVLEFAAAFGTFLEPGRPVVLGRDPRLSGHMIREGVLASLLGCGHDVIDLGVVSTPVVQHAIQRLDAAGGIAISASHNTIDWNALRFFGPSGIYLNTAEAGELLDIYHLRRFRFAPWDQLGKLTVTTEAIDAYLDGLARVFDLPRLRPLRVVVDCCNGASALILRRMNERFGCGFILINERVDGRTVAHTPNTKEMVLPLLADSLLPASPGKLIIANLSSTALLEDVAARHGGRVLRVPVGRQAAIDALSTYRPEQIALAGEGTGAVMMPQFRFVYDGIASMLAILHTICDRGQPLSRILAGYPRHHILKAEVPLTSPRIPALLEELQELFPDGELDRSDGLRIAWPDRWFHVRVSQTEPIIRVIAEQRDSEPRELFETLLDRVRRWN